MEGKVSEEGEAGGGEKVRGAVGGVGEGLQLQSDFLIMCFWITRFFRLYPKRMPQPELT